MAVSLLDRANETTTTAGTGTVTLSGTAFSSAWQTWSNAGAVNATQYYYLITDGANEEWGIGTYTSSGTTFSRDTVIGSVIGGVSGTTKITLSGSASIACVPPTQAWSKLLDNYVGSTQGDLAYRGASLWTALAPGAAGQQLQTGGAGANPSWVNGLYLYSSTTTSGSQSNITVSSIPSGWRNMKIILTGRSNTSALTDGIVGQFNGDTGNNYDYQYIFGTGTSPSAGHGEAQSSFTLGNVPAATATANRSGSATTDIPGYSSTTFDKVMLMYSGYFYQTVSGNSVYLSAFTWRSTSAISSLKAFLASGSTFVDGTQLDLYLY